jgi:hypothetical protein
VWRHSCEKRLPGPNRKAISLKCFWLFVELFVDSLPCFERFSPGSPVFLPTQKSTFLNSNSIMYWGPDWNKPLSFFSYPRKTRHVFPPLSYPTPCPEGASFTGCSWWYVALYFPRNRLQILERKLMCLEMFNNMYKALDKMRSKSVLLDDETNEEMRQRVSEECKW